jgi:hypothetical protein
LYNNSSIKPNKKARLNNNNSNNSNHTTATNTIDGNYTTHAESTTTAVVNDNVITANKPGEVEHMIEDEPLPASPVHRRDRIDVVWDMETNDPGMS